ncbi:hypothetical protein CVT25_011288 [Psilocybe cyanescens]|uniref:Uncharacterized protein n=1 Tax=Psilocybe cyanescens TaxID=93625 RepID=A0A409XC86_PSICY|nr:hypothetical protein CVT25_011288 [Psilocybe cyanescens]
MNAPTQNIQLTPNQWRIRDTIIDNWLRRAGDQQPGLRRGPGVDGKQESLQVYGYPFFNEDLDHLLVNKGIPLNLGLPPVQRHAPAYDMILSMIPKRLDSSFQPWRWVHGPADENDGRLLVLVVATNETWQDLVMASDHAYLRAVRTALGHFGKQPSWFIEYD